MRDTQLIMSHDAPGRGHSHTLSSALCFSIFFSISLSLSPPFFYSLVTFPHFSLLPPLFFFPLLSHSPLLLSLPPSHFLPLLRPLCLNLFFSFSPWTPLLPPFWSESLHLATGQPRPFQSDLISALVHCGKPEGAAGEPGCRGDESDRPSGTPDVHWFGTSFACRA